MNKLARASGSYTGLGLLSGIYYRELTRYMKYDRQLPTQLRAVHTHCLALGGLFFLIVLLLEKSFTLSGQKHFKKFYVTYNMGLGLTLLAMLVRGTSTVFYGETKMPLVSVTAGIGHIILTVSFGFFYNILINAVRQVSNSAGKH